MNNTTFQQLPSGIAIGTPEDSSSPAQVVHTPKLQLVKKPGSRFAGSFDAGAYMTSVLTAAVSGRGKTGPIDPGLPAVTVDPETFDVQGPGGNVTNAGAAPFQAFQLSRLASGSMAVPSADLTVAI